MNINCIFLLLFFCQNRHVLRKIKVTPIISYWLRRKSKQTRIPRLAYTNTKKWLLEISPEYARIPPEGAAKCRVQRKDGNQNHSELPLSELWTKKTATTTKFAKYGSLNFRSTKTNNKQFILLKFIQIYTIQWVINFVDKSTLFL